MDNWKEQFAEHVTSTAFHLTLTHNQVSLLAHLGAHSLMARCSGFLYRMRERRAAA